ncbi:MAG: hypothetical protein O9322_02835 [Beijerinckiaceae bacterium]|nr:hypothetical protein [Beijerinckiaceae bacterium]MCZ8301500.1 hypothetical protein [Beijerinckiaceae bacterium]
MVDESEIRARPVVMAALLRQGRLVHGVGLVFLVATLALAIGLALDGRLAGPAALLLGCGLLAGLGESWFAFRVALDADLFRRIGAGQLTLDGLDAALSGLGLLPQGKAGRPLDARMAGAKALLAKQVGLAGLQLILLLAMLAILILRTPS